MTSKSWQAVPVLLLLAAACGTSSETAGPPPDTADLAGAPPAQLAGAAVLLRKGEWQKARNEAESAIKAAGESGPLDFVLASHAIAGRACAKLDDEKCAEAEYAAVTAAWAEPESPLKRLEALGGDEAAQQRRLARALTTVGEALFFSAEQKRREADKLPRPVYRGSGSREETLAFVNTQVKDWVAAKRPAIEEAEEAYKKVVELRPAPPPRWVIAAAERTGGMWSRFVDDFRDSPMPKEWQGDGNVPGTDDLTYAELRAEYHGKLNEASEPQLETARSAYTTCRDWAVKYQIADERSRACDAWLAAHPKP